MRSRHLFALLAAVVLAVAPVARADQAPTDAPARVERALLIGVDEFVTKPDVTPGSAHNIELMQQMLTTSLLPLETVATPHVPVTSAGQLTDLIRSTFGAAQPGDVSYLYISTHGEYDPATGQAMLLLSDGTTEGHVTPAQLHAAFDGIAGLKVIILDACNSGAFIGKGAPGAQPWFTGNDFKVIASSGALEESWYWSADLTGDDELRGHGPQGAFYFTQALAQSLSAAYGFPADQNRDGAVTLSELHAHLLAVHGASTPQVYPVQDDAVLFRCNTQAQQPRAPVVDILFSGSVLSRARRQIDIEFIATRPVRVAYQIVYRRNGRWAFESARLIYDAAERFTAYGDRAGAVSAGHKLRTLNIDQLPPDSSGYVLVQLITIDEGRLNVHAGRVLCVPPANGHIDLQVALPDRFAPGRGRELPIHVTHSAPCALSVAIVDETDAVVHRVCHRQATRPMGLDPEGSMFYWNGVLKDGAPAAPGTYRVRVQAHIDDTTVTAFSAPFTIE